METKPKVVWHDESYKDRDGKKVNPFPGILHLISTSHLPKGKEQEKVYYIVYRTKDGRQHREKAGRQFRDKMTPARAAGIRDARVAGRELPNRARRELAAAEKRMKAARWDFDRLFEAYVKAKGPYPRKVTDSGNFRVHLAPVVGKKTPAELTGFDIDRIKRDMKKPRKVTLKSRKPEGKDRVVTKGNCQPGTVVAALGFLVRLSSFGVKRNLCEGIKVHVELPKVSTVRTEAMSDGQMTAYLTAAAACGNKVIGAFMTFLLLTGLRLNEARSLTWDAVNLQDGSVHLRNPKGGKDQFLPLNPAAVDLLNRLERDPDNPYAFQGEPDPKGKRKRSGRIGISTAVRYGRKFAETAGLRNFRPVHALRHSFASALASSGEVNMYVLQKLMTHRSATTTQRYAHLRDETLRRGADVMGRIVEEATAETA